MDKKTTWAIVAVVVIILIVLLVVRATTSDEAIEPIVVGENELVLSPVTDEEEFTVDHVELTSPGYVVVWTPGASRTDDAIIGTSALLPAGPHNNVAITRRPDRRYVTSSNRVTVTVHYDDGDGVVEPTEEPIATTDDGTELAADVPIEEPEEAPEESATTTPETEADDTDTTTVPAQQENTTETADPSPESTEEQEQVDDTTTIPEARTVVVTYTDSGFEPAVVTIKAGDAVEFVNKSQGGMWVASAVHPTHEELPEFDQGEAVTFNGVYDFTFDDEGEWRYHNHENSEHTGTVIVAAE